MLRFFARKALRLTLLLTVVSVVSFVLVSLSPIDPVRAYVGADMMRVSPEQRAAIAERWGVDRPPIQRFFAWASNLLRGDLGTSLIYRQPVARVIGERFAASLALMAAAWIITGVVGYLLGIISGTLQGSLLDKAIQFYAFTMASVPPFWLALVLLIVFSVWLGWTPIGLAQPAGTLDVEVTLLERLHHLILPALTLGIIGVANVTLHTRQKLIDVKRSDYYLFSVARGLSTWQAVTRHGLRNTALPAITLQFALFSEIFGGAVLAEQVFSYPGLGRATVQAGLRGDVPLLLGIVLFSTVFVFVGNTIADLIYQIVDPRIRLQGGR
ncbi:MAG: ABC transporter permease [Anaerosomatales bacterium]|nr:ABC transporter permease [Anaerosomatales bacterium]